MRTLRKKSILSACNRLANFYSHSHSFECSVVMNAYNLALSFVGTSISQDVLLKLCTLADLYSHTFDQPYFSVIQTFFRKK